MLSWHMWAAQLKCSTAAVGVGESVPGSWTSQVNDSKRYLWSCWDVALPCKAPALLTLGLFASVIIRPCSRYCVSKMLMWSCRNIQIFVCMQHFICSRAVFLNVRLIRFIFVLISVRAFQMRENISPSDGLQEQLTCFTSPGFFLKGRIKLSTTAHFQRPWVTFKSNN